MKKGNFEVEGKSYVFKGHSNPDYNEYLKKLNLKLKNKKIYYYHIYTDGDICKK